MKIKIEIQIDDDTAIYINRFLGTQEPESQATTHGPLDTAGLTKMLLEDVALAVRRPGSWEGARMTDLLTSHGYSVEWGRGGGQRRSLPRHRIGLALNRPSFSSVTSCARGRDATAP